jgi:uncharacterized membrane protein (UPF0127 family)
MLERHETENHSVVSTHMPFAFVVYEGRRILRTRVADSFLARARGLLARPPLGADEAMLIRSCNAIHTIGMSYTLDVVFFDKAGVMLKLGTVDPSSFFRCRAAHAVLEMHEGTIGRFGMVAGQQLRLESAGFSRQPWECNNT